jgi:DNA-binding protein H-NS
MTNVNANSLELLKQSEEIRKQAEALKKKEAPEVLARIREAVAHYGFTAADLGLAGNKASAKAGKAGRLPKTKSIKAPTKSTSAIRFTDPKGNKWSGIGRKPKWFQDALAAGATIDSLKA